MIDKALAHTSFFFIFWIILSEILFQLVAVGEMVDRLVWGEEKKEWWERTGPDNGSRKLEKPRLVWRMTWRQWQLLNKRVTSWKLNWRMTGVAVLYCDARIGVETWYPARPPRILLNWPRCQMANHKARAKDGLWGGSMSWALTLQVIFIPSQMFP